MFLIVIDSVKDQIDSNAYNSLLRCIHQGQVDVEPRSKLFTQVQGALEAKEIHSKYLETIANKSVGRYLIQLFVTDVMSRNSRASNTFMSKVNEEYALLLVLINGIN